VGRGSLQRAEKYLKQLDLWDKKDVQFSLLSGVNEATLNDSGGAGFMNPHVLIPR